LNIIVVVRSLVVVAAAGDDLLIAMRMVSYLLKRALKRTSDCDFLAALRQAGSGNKHSNQKTDSIIHRPLVPAVRISSTREFFGSLEARINQRFENIYKITSVCVCVCAIAM